MSRFSSLPNEISENVYSFMDLNSLWNLLKTDKSNKYKVKKYLDLYFRKKYTRKTLTFKSRQNKSIVDGSFDALDLEFITKNMDNYNLNIECNTYYNNITKLYNLGPGKVIIDGTVRFDDDYHGKVHTEFDVNLDYTAKNYKLIHNDIINIIYKVVDFNSILVDVTNDPQYQDIIYASMEFYDTISFKIQNMFDTDTYHYTNIIKILNIENNNKYIININEEKRTLTIENYHDNRESLNFADFYLKDIYYYEFNTNDDNYIENFINIFIDLNNKDELEHIIYDIIHISNKYSLILNKENHY